ncbi:MAG: hypothetical protein WBJ21_01545 [Burkholderiaceae bacterium]
MDKVSKSAFSALQDSMTPEMLAEAIDKVSRGNNPLYSYEAQDAGGITKVFIRKQTKSEQFANLFTSKEKRVAQHASLLKLIQDIADKSPHNEQAQSVLRNIRTALGTGNVKFIPDLLQPLFADSVLIIKGTLAD